MLNLINVLMDFSEHRIIGIIVGISIALVSLTAILIRYFVHKNKNKKKYLIFFNLIKN